MIKIAICDDLDSCRKQLSQIIKDYASLHSELQIDCSVYDYGEELIVTANKIGGFDIYFLDIVMPGLNGIDLGSALRDGGYNGKIVFLTSSEEYAIESFKVKPFNYILKPIEKDKVFSALDEVISALSSKKEKSIIVKTTDGNVKLSVDNIMYAELINRAVFYYLANGRIVESTTIRTSFSNAVKELIENNSFVLCGSSFIVNLLRQG